VTLLSIPESSFNAAFKMFDLDHNGCVIQLLALIFVCKLVSLLSCLEVLLSDIDGCMYVRSFIAGDI
jgi:Ca2+-binding EF-hand superfamily protein